MQRAKDIFNKSRKSYWIKSGFLTLLNRLSVSLFGFLNFYLLIRVLPQTEYGLWMLFISVTTVIEMIKAGFIRNPLIKFSQKKETYAQVLTGSLILNTAISLLMAILLFLFSHAISTFWNHTSLEDLFIIYIATLLLLIPLNHYDFVQQANLSFKGSLFSEFTRQFVFFICLISYYFSDRPLQLPTLAFFQVISVGLAALVSFLFARRYLKFTFKSSFHGITALFSYGKYTFGSSVSAMLMRNTDTWMLGKIMSPLAVALYNPALRIANLLEIPALTLASVLFPKLSRQVARKDQKSAKKLYEKSVGVILCCVLPFVVFVLIFAEPVTIFIAGEKYRDTAPILRITVIYSLFLPFNRQLGVTLEAIGKAGTNFRFVIRNMLLNIAFNYFFIINFGIIGAAYGTLTTYILTSIYNQIYLHRFLHVSFLNVIQYTINSYLKVYHLSIGQLQKK